MTLIDVMVGTAVMLVVFLGIFGAFKLSIQLVYNTKAKAGAIALITDQLEYVRGLAYDSIGTVGGIPSGAIPQVQQKTMNGIGYIVRTVVQYIDAPEDGLGASDSNGIAADYKSAKVEALWMVQGQSRSAMAVTAVAPHGVESLTSGGTLRVNVFDAAAVPVQGASVQVVNASVSPAVDVTVLTNSRGIVEFLGTPPASNYQVFVTKPGYSSAQTYAVSAGNPNPNPGNMSVINNQTSATSFAIDHAGSLSIFTYSPAGPVAYRDTFTNQSGLSETFGTAVSNGAVVLSGEPGSYYILGSAASIPVSPQYLASWDSLSFTASTSPATTALVNISYWNASTSSYDLVPDNILSGNSGGFTASPVDLSALDPAKYDTLKVRTALSTTDASSTPSVLDWSFDYHAGPTPLPNIDFSIRGTKTIGSAGSGLPVYKMNTSSTTDAAGMRAINPIEWDTYLISLVSGSPYAIVEQCPAAATIAPGQMGTVSLLLADAPVHSLRVVVSGGSGPIANAVITISGPTSASASTGSCGQVFFPGIPSSNSYTVSVSAPGFQTITETNVSVSGQSVLPISLVTAPQ
jgi:hypothetical protein